MTNAEDRNYHAATATKMVVAHGGGVRSSGSLYVGGTVLALLLM